MATWSDVEAIGLGLPGTSLTTSWNRPAVHVNDKWFALDRGPRPDAVDADGGRIDGLIVLYVVDDDAKMALAQDESGYFMTTPHFAKSRMILVRLEHIPIAELTEVLIESWLLRAPKRLASAYLKDEAH